MLVFSSSSLLSQQINLDEATAYLQYIINEDLSSQDILYEGEKEVDILIVDNKVVIRYIWNNNEKVLLSGCNYVETNYNELIIEPLKISKVFESSYDGFYTLSLQCQSKKLDCLNLKTQCLHPLYSYNYSDDPIDVSHFNHINLFYLKNSEVANMGIKVLRYVFDEITRDLISEKSKINNLFTESSANNKVEVIHYQKDQGLAIIPIEIDGFSVDVILDSGASSVSISKKLEKNLLDQGIISESDYIEPGLFRIADGSISQKNRLILPHIDIGNVRVNNVLASVNSTDDIILLGSSFLDAFKSWKINNSLNQLILEY
jgi:clan AA aspartic protease (TIGR02281 family)